MKKIALVLSVAMIFACCIPLAGCGSNSNQTPSNTQTPSNSKKEVTLTKDNFRDYFAIEVETDTEITKHGDEVILGVYIAPSYSAVAAVDVNVYTTSPVDVYDVVVTLEITNGSVYWNDQTITLRLSSSGSASKKLTISTSDDQKILLEYYCNAEFRARIVSVEGTIREN